LAKVITAWWNYFKGNAVRTDIRILVSV
jgi:hypothetical protein